MYDVTILGCGITGAALAYKLSRYHLKILVLERENDIAMGTTRANSAIIHAGYDPRPGTLMAKLNVDGSRQMKSLCQELDVLYQAVGSMVLAFSEQDLDTLNRLYAQGIRNGVQKMQLLSGDKAKSMEPNLSAQVVGALLAPTAAVTDPWGLCIALAETAVKNGAEVRLSSPAVGLESASDHMVIHTPLEDINSRYVINCTGVHGGEIASMLGTPHWTDALSKGEYYLLDKSSGGLVSHIIFQCPSSGSKGVLVAPTVHGNLIVGPNAHPVKDGDDTSTTDSGLEFVASACRKSVPEIDLRQSIRNFAGVRANTSESDFIIRPAEETPRMIHAAGIRSPGLSAAPAIADYIIDLLRDAGLKMEEKVSWNGSRKQIRFRSLSASEKADLISRCPSYGRVICRCETITEGEILDAIHSPIPPCSLDGIKRRAGSGMGRCQGGFCGPRILEILARELHRAPEEILKDGAGSHILLNKRDGGKAL